MGHRLENAFNRHFTVTHKTIMIWKKVWMLVFQLKKNQKISENALFVLLTSCVVEGRAGGRTISTVLKDCRMFSKSVCDNGKVELECNGKSFFNISILTLLFHIGNYQLSELWNNYLCWTNCWWVHNIFLQTSLSWLMQFFQRFQHCLTFCKCDKE